MTTGNHNITNKDYIREITGPHEATYAPDDGGYAVTCPHGCNLGTSAFTVSRLEAERRVELHRHSTRPLTPEARERARDRAAAELNANAPALDAVLSRTEAIDEALAALSAAQTTNSTWQATLEELYDKAHQAGAEGR